MSRDPSFPLLSADPMQNEMFSPSGEYSESRPFKIFISLLDKWEIGGPLADILIYDAFKAIKQLMEENKEGSDDVSLAPVFYRARNSTMV